MKKFKKKNCDRAVEKYFRRELLPAAAAAVEERGLFFPLQPDAEAESYYARCEKRSMSAADFILEGCDSFEKLWQALEELWRKQGYPGLARTGGKAAELAERLYNVESESDEVSPFIYVMF